MQYLVAILNILYDGFLNHSTINLVENYKTIDIPYHVYLQLGFQSDLPEIDRYQDRKVSQLKPETFILDKH